MDKQKFYCSLDLNWAGTQISQTSTLSFLSYSILSRIIIICIQILSSNSWLGQAFFILVVIKVTLLFSVHFIRKLTVDPPITFIYSANIDWVLLQMSGTVLDTRYPKMNEIWSLISNCSQINKREREKTKRKHWGGRWGRGVKYSNGRAKATWWWEWFDSTTGKEGLERAFSGRDASVRSWRTSVSNQWMLVDAPSKTLLAWALELFLGLEYLFPPGGMKKLMRKEKTHWPQSWEEFIPHAS